MEEKFKKFNSNGKKENFTERDDLNQKANIEQKLQFFFEGEHLNQNGIEIMRSYYFLNTIPEDVPPEVFIKLYEHVFGMSNAPAGCEICKNKVQNPEENIENAS